MLGMPDNEIRSLNYIPLSTTPRADRALLGDGRNMLAFRAFLRYLDALMHEASCDLASFKVRSTWHVARGSASTITSVPNTLYRYAHSPFVASACAFGSKLCTLAMLSPFFLSALGLLLFFPTAASSG